MSLRQLYYTSFSILSVCLCLCAATDNSRYDVIIVGAGASGISAGMRLLENNVTNFIILEARSRIGGRIHAIPFGGTKVDIGGLWYRAPDGTLKMKDEITEEEKEIEGEIRTLGGIVLKEELYTAFAQGKSKLTTSPLLYNFSGSYNDYLFPRMRGYLETFNPTSEEMEILLDTLKRVESSDNGADLELVGPKGVWEYSIAEEDEKIEWNEAFQKFLLFMKDVESKSVKGGIMDKIKLNHEVVKVNVGDGGVTITCSDGEKYHGSRALLTLPLGVIKDLPEDFFDPKLPAKNREAINAIGNGDSEMIYLHYENRWWPKKLALLFGMTSDMVKDYKSASKFETWPASTGGFYSVPYAPNILQVWTTSEVIKEMEGDSAPLDSITYFMQKLFGNDSFTVPKPKSYVKSTWYQDKYSKGSYSYLTVEAERNNISGLDLAEPILDSKGKPVLLFAGEATHQNYTGTTSGAADTGFREADKILELLASEKDSSNLV